MTNLHTKIVISIFSALFLTLAGCKKEEPSSYTFTLEATSLDFEWGQTKTISFTSKNINRYGTPVVPEGWTCTRKGNTLTITAPANSGGGDQTGSIQLPADTATGISITRTITVKVRIAEEITRVANSIIVSEPNKRFKINALRRGSETNETITGAVSGSLVWSTSGEALVNVSLENGYLFFATGADEEFELIEANAVVGVFDKDGNALWSWHIWITDFDPAADPDIVDGFEVMNRNLGAFANSDASPEDVVRSYGLYYQWGRKDPFVGPFEWDSTVQQPIFAGSGQGGYYSFAVSSAETGTVEYAIAHPATFIAGKDGNFDWLQTPDTGLWREALKTVYDPCPVGWRVAPSDIWKGFVSGETDDAEGFNVEGEYVYGWRFVNGEETIFYPASGRRSFSPSLASTTRNYTNVVNDDNGVGYPVGFYWSATYPAPVPSITSQASEEGTGSLVFRHDYINIGWQSARDISETAPAGGFPLRCVAE